MKTRTIVALVGSLGLLVYATPRLAGLQTDPSRTASASAPAAAGATAGEFVWHDLVTDDPGRSRTFYGSLFGWTFEAAEGVDPGYIVIKHDGRRIGGIVTRMNRDGNENVAEWLSYLVVADVDQAAKTLSQGGGRIYRGPLNARKGLRVAVVADPQGAPIGLASRGPLEGSEEGPPPVHHWLWMEYVARDPEAALKFYASAIGFAHEVSQERKDFTYYLLTTGRPRAGMFRSPWPRDTSAWLPYVRVADPAASAARAVELGGTMLLAPRADIRGGSLAIVLDPTGAPIALQKFPFESKTP